MIDKNGRRVAKKDLPPDGIPQHQLDAMTSAQKAAIAQAMKPLTADTRSGTKPTAKPARKKSTRKATKTSTPRGRKQTTSEAPAASDTKA